MREYKCPECGTSSSYDCLCRECESRHHRQEVENWTEDDVLEKIKIVIDKLNSDKEDDNNTVFSSDECIIIDDLLSKGVDISSITKAAVEKGIYWPSELYYKANDEYSYDVIGSIKYSEFIKKLPKEKYKFIDANNILVEALNRKEMENLLS